MATNSINRIARGNLNLKPLILSKNPTDIVNGYVQKLYQQLPEQFKQDLMKPRTAESQHQTWGLLKNVNIPMTCFVNGSRARRNIRATSYKSQLKQMPAKNNFVKTPRELLRTPNLKIYNTRKYVSSASSSSVSFQRHDRRKKLKRSFDFASRTITGSAAHAQRPKKQKVAQNMSTLVASTGPAHMKPSPAGICSNLMNVTSDLKRQIRLTKPRLEPISFEQKDKEGSGPLHGWPHPKREHLNKFMSTTAKFQKPPPQAIDRGLLNLMEFKRVPLKTNSPDCEAKINSTFVSVFRKRSSTSFRGTKPNPLKPSTARIAHKYEVDSRKIRTARTDYGLPPTVRTPSTSCLFRSALGKANREDPHWFRRY